jgi:hypothetical protein
MFVIFVAVAVLVAWSLHLMQQALSCQEFSLMLAGFLVASSAAALVAVYCLMADYMGYMSALPQDNPGEFYGNLPLSQVEIVSIVSP